MPPHRVTLSEVAKRAGVSRTTASFVLNGRQDMRISKSSQDRVRQAAAELNYRPNLISHSLRTSVTHTIALVSDTVATDPYAGQAIYGSFSAALDNDRLLFIGETEGQREIEERLVEGFLARQVDGFVYASMYTREVSLPRRLRGHPVALLNCSSRGNSLPAVVPDEHEAGRSAARILIDAGHSARIFVVGERAPRVFAGRERLAGIESAMRSAGTELSGTLECAWWPDAAHDAVAAFLRRGGVANAFLCLNDRVALGAYQALTEAGLTIPEDVSVVSFDDSELASWLRPKLTSIGLPHFEMGRRAVELLLSDDRPRGIERIPMPVRTRGSVGPPRT